MSGHSLLVYTTHDLIGVELARAGSSVIALAAGVANILDLGTPARAILITRGAAEFARIAVKLGAEERTFFGLAGVGEFVAATERRGSADFELGRLLGQRVPLAEALKQVGRVLGNSPSSPTVGTPIVKVRAMAVNTTLATSGAGTAVVIFGIRKGITSPAPTRAHTRHGHFLRCGTRDRATKHAKGGRRPGMAGPLRDRHQKQRKHHPGAPRGRATGAVHGARRSPGRCPRRAGGDTWQ